MISDCLKTTAIGRSGPVAVYCLPFFLILFLILPAGPLFAGTDDQSIMEVRRILENSRLSGPEVERVLSVCREAEEKDIPPSMLVPRIREGLAKRIHLSRLILTLKRDILGLIEARDLILQIEGAGEFLQQHNLWQRTANMNAAGFSTRVIRSLIEMSMTESEVYQPITGLFAALTEWGLTDVQGLRVVQSVVRSDLSQDEYPQVTSLFTRARKAYLSPDELIKRMESELPRVRNLKQLEGRILE